MRSKVAVLLAAIGLLFGRESFGATELMVNGGFEASSNGWQAAGSLTSVPVVTSQPQAHSGNNFLSLGNQNGPVVQGVFQTVTIPTNTLLARYSYFLGASSGDLAGASTFSALVVSTNSSQTILATLDTEGNTSANYQPFVFDLTSFAGRTVEIAFQDSLPTLGVGVKSFFAVDDVSLLSFTSNDIPANDDFTNSATLVTTTNISVLATNFLATKEPGEPKHDGIAGGHSVWWNWTAPSNGVATIDTTGSTFDTLLAVYTGASVSNLTQVAADDNDDSRGVVTSRVKINATAGTQYQIAVDGKNGATGVVQLNLSFSADTKDPTVTISSPKSKSQVTSSTVTVQGKATDNLAVALVQYRLENAAGTNDYQNADGTNAWSATVNGLIPGPNTIRVIAFDTSSNISASAAVTVTYAVVSPIAVTISGSGTVSPNLNGQSLDVGSTFTMTAKPSAGQVFSNWTGSVTSTSAKLTFMMQSNMVLQANFTPNPFTPLAGTYQGLFFDPNNPAHQSSGFFSATVTSSGSFSAKLIVAGKAASLSGVFSAGGVVSNNIVVKGGTPVSAQLQLDMAGGGITGTLGGTFNNSPWTAQLNAGRIATGSIPEAGKYTMLIPGFADGAGHPGGDSYGTVTVSTKGAIAFKGVLADGTKVTQKADLLANGQWPFYISLYGGNGSILGWLTINTAGTNDISGNVDWFKLALAGGKLYPAGFTIGTNTLGSAYVFTKGESVLNVPGGQLWLANGNLASSFTNGIAIDAASKVTSPDSSVKMTITTSTGLFKGTVVDPASNKAISINGVVLQKQNFGGGFFTGATESGRVFLGP